jgi:hypothetical protein
VRQDDDQPLWLTGPSVPDRVPGAKPPFCGTIARADCGDTAPLTACRSVPLDCADAPWLPPTLVKRLSLQEGRAGTHSRRTSLWPAFPVTAKNFSTRMAAWPRLSLRSGRPIAGIAAVRALASPDVQMSPEGAKG